MWNAENAVQLPERASVAVAFDFEEDCVRALREALDRAAQVENSEVHVLHAQATEGHAPSSMLQRLGAHIRSAIQAARAHWGGRPRVVTHIRNGSLRSTMPRLAKEVDASLLVVGKGRLQGKSGEALREALGSCERPVLVVGPSSAILAQH